MHMHKERWKDIIKNDKTIIWYHWIVVFGEEKTKTEKLNRTFLIVWIMAQFVNVPKITYSTKNEIKFRHWNIRSVSCMLFVYNICVFTGTLEPKIKWNNL